MLEYPEVDQVPSDTHRHLRFKATQDDATTPYHSAIQREGGVRNYWSNSDGSIWLTSQIRTTLAFLVMMIGSPITEMLEAQC